MLGFEDSGMDNLKLEGQSYRTKKYRSLPGIYWTFNLVLGKSWMWP